MIRKLAVAVAALTLMTCAQALAVCTVQTQHMAALVTDEGERLAEAEVIFSLVEDALYAVGSPGDYALCDAQGIPLTDSRYEMLEAVQDVILCRQNGLFGAMDKAGEILISPEWASLTYAGEGAFLALSGDIYDDLPDEIIRLTSQGERLNTGSLTAIGLRAFHDGRMPFMLSDGQYGYVDALGRQVIPPQWRWAGDFADGVAIVSDVDGMGLIDIEGRIVIPPTYAWMQRSAGRIAALNDDGGLDVYSADGSKVLFTVGNVTEAELCGEYVIARDGQASRVYGTDGVCVLEASPDVLFYPGLDGQFIAMDGAWGEACQYLANPDGSTASGRYQRLLPLCAGRYAFIAFEPGDYDSARYGLMAADGEVLLDAEYREILPAGADRLALVSDDAVVFADCDGNALQSWPLS